MGSVRRTANRERSTPTARDDARLVEAMRSAVIVTDPEGIVTLWNPAAEQLYGRPAEEAIGRPVLDVTAAEPAAVDVAAVLTGPAEGRAWRGELLLRRADGATFVGRMTATPVTGDDGEVVEVIRVSEDVTEHYRHEDRLRVALEAAHLGVWEWDGATGTVTFDETMQRLVGLVPGTFDGTYATYLELVHPDDRRAVTSAFTDVGSSSVRTLEHRVVWPDSSVHWLEGRWHVRRDHSEAVAMVGVATDVTERHLADAERNALLVAEAAARREAEAARSRSEFVAEVTEALTEDLDLDVRLDRLVHLTVPRIADGSAVHLVDETDPGRARLRALHHTDADVEEALWQLADRFPVQLDARAGVGAVIRRGSVLHVDELDDSSLAAVSRSDEHLEALRRLAIRSMVSIPLIGRNGPIGAVTFATTSSRRLDDDAIELAMEVCGRAAVAIENALLVLARARAELQLRFHAALLEAQNQGGTEGVLVVDPEGTVLSSNRQFTTIWDLDPALVEERSDDVLIEAAASKVVDPEAFVAGIRSVYETQEAGGLEELVLTDGRVIERFGAPLHGSDGEYFGWAWYFRDVTAARRNQAEVAAVGERFAALARTLQQSLLPATLPNFPGIDLGARYHPAFEGIEVGGDFYDVFAVTGAWMLVIGDVCGKGADAAALTALARYTIRAAAMHDDHPDSVLTELNAAMLAHRVEGADSRFVTVCCVRLEQEPGYLRATVSCGGHAPPVVIRADGTTEDLGETGTLIGLFEEVDIPTSSVDLHPGDALVALTDGVMEARNAAGVQLDELDLHGMLGGLAGRSALDISEAIETRALEHQDGVAHDDIAILVARVLPAD